MHWDEAQQLDWGIRHWEAMRKAGLPVDSDFGEFWRQLEWMGLQRHLKVAGIFARLTLRDGKPKYLADAPRFDQINADNAAEIAMQAIDQGVLPVVVSLVVGLLILVIDAIDGRARVSAIARSDACPCCGPLRGDALTRLRWPAKWRRSAKTARRAPCRGR
mgnify:CR=1 FL=1